MSIASRILVASIALLSFLRHAHATETCPSDFWVHAKCVPDTVLQEALQSVEGKQLTDVMKYVFDTAAVATETKNNVFEAGTDQTSSWAEIFPGSSWLFGPQQIKPTRNKHLSIFTTYCKSNSGSIKQVATVGASNERITAFCIAKDGKGIAGLIVMPPQKDRLLDTKFVFQVHYFPATLTQKLFDFWSGMKVGDKTHVGMVIEVKAPIAKIQTQGKEQWYEIEALLPKDFNRQ